MKNFLTIAAVMAFAVLAGTAYAGDQPSYFDGKDIGLVLSDDAIMTVEHVKMDVETGSAAGGLRFKPAATVGTDQPTYFGGKDLGLVLSDDAITTAAHVEMDVEKGAGAGGMRFEPGETYKEVKINIDRSYLGPGGSDLP